jgi:GMP synthase (glutamine-hydrolysing)
LTRRSIPLSVLLVLENEVDPDYRYFGAALRDSLADVDVYDYVEEGGRPSVDGVDGVVVAGSTAGVYESDDHPWMDDEAAFVADLVAEGVPTLGICFGHQLVNEALGGTVEHRGLRAELVDADLADDELFEGVHSTLPAVHGDVVVEPGDGMRSIGSVPGYDHFATRHREAPVWTTQFHPEFTAALLPRVRRDFGWTDNGRSFDDVTGIEALANFERIVANA